jgi:hypothetical protein
LNCTLAISGWHIFELRRYADSSAREERYQLLKELCPIRCQSSPIDSHKRANERERRQRGANPAAEVLKSLAVLRFINENLFCKLIREIDPQDAESHNNKQG